MPVGDIVVRIRGDDRSFSAAARRARAENNRLHSSINRGARQSVTGLRALEQSTLRLRARMVGLRAVAGGTTAFFAGRGIFQYADQWKLAEARIGSVTGDLSVARGEMAQLVQLANRSRGSIDTLANAYSKLRLSRDELNKDTTFDLVETLQKSLIIGGNTPQEVRSVILQLTQGIAADQLGGEELRTIRESGFFFQKILADGLGVTVGDLKQLGAESKLTAKAVVEAVTSMSDRVDQEFGKIPVTVGQASTLVNNSLREYIGNADRTVGASAVMAEGLQLLAGNFDALANGGIIAVAGGASLLFARNVGQAGSRMASSAINAVNYQRSIRLLARDQQFAAGVSLASARADIQKQRASILASQADLRAATTTKAKDAANKQLMASTRLLVAAQRAEAIAATQVAAAQSRAALSTRAAALAGTALRGALAFIGGPLGAAVLAVAGGFALWARNARKAKDATQQLLRTADAVSSLRVELEDGNFVQTRDIQRQNIDRITDAIKAQEDAIKRLSERRKELSAESVFRSGGLVGVVSGTAPRSGEEEKELSNINEELAEREAELARTREVLTEVTKRGTVTQEEYDAAKKSALAGGSIFETKPPESFLNSLDKLRDKVSLVRAEYEAQSSGGSVKEATLVQQTINSLTNDGVKVTAAMRGEIVKLSAAYGEYNAKIEQTREFERSITRLRSSVLEARAELTTINTPGVVSEGAAKAVEIYNSLIEKGIQITPQMKAEIVTLSEEYAKLQGDITAANDAKEEYNNRLEQATQLSQQYQTPLEAYRKRIKEIRDLHQNFPSVFTQAQFEQARVEAVSQYADHLRDARSEQLKLSEDLAQGVLRADSLGDALRNVGTQLQTALTDRFLLEPLTNGFDNILSGVGGTVFNPPANDNANKTVDEFGNIVEKAGQKVQGGFVSSITSSITSIFTKNAADTASAAATATKTAIETADTAALTGHTAIVGKSTEALAELSIAAKQASSSFGAGGASNSASGFLSSGFAGFFQDGGVIPTGRFGVVGEAGPEIISAASGPLRVTPLGQVASVQGGGGGQKIVYAPTYSINGASQAEINQLKRMMAEDRESFTSKIQQYEFDKARGIAA